MPLRINLISCLSPFAFSGGGERVIRYIIEAGIKRGHRFGFCHADPPENSLLEKADLTILADLFNQTVSGRSMDSVSIERVVQKEPYIHIDNAYVDICTKPYLPCNGRARSYCKYAWLPRDIEAFRRNLEDYRRCFHRLLLSKTNGDFPKKQERPGLCSALWRRELYRNSALNIFVSPLHRNTVHRVLIRADLAAAMHIRRSGKTEKADSFRRLRMTLRKKKFTLLQKSHVIEPLIDSTKFFVSETEKREILRREKPIGYLFAGVLNEAKGLWNMRKYEKKFLKDRKKKGRIFAVGTKRKYIYWPSGRFAGPVAYDEMAEYMKRAVNFIYLPRWPEPQGRVVVEAALARCRIVANGNVGALSFSHDISRPIDIDEILARLWRRIELCAYRNKKHGNGGRDI